MPQGSRHRTASNISNLIEFEPLDVGAQVGAWNHVREITVPPDIACSVCSRDQTAVLTDERPKRQNRIFRPPRVYAGQGHRRKYPERSNLPTLSNMIVQACRVGRVPSADRQSNRPPG